MDELERPDPDRLLRRLQDEERRSQRGNLKIFFGYVAGVGKTYAMLERGSTAVGRRRGRRGRLRGDPRAPGDRRAPRRLGGAARPRVDHRGVKLREFDLDAALARHPGIILVDELAHTNAPGKRHPKRWMDVEELLEAGINVYTTLNVQHLESLNDTIRMTTGIQVRETVPDSVFDEADSVEVVDLPPGELRQRVSQGKVYVPAQAARAMENFFKGPNLGALREIAFRRTADRTHAHMEDARLASGGREQTWRLSDTLMVCVGPSPTSARIVRVSRRMASANGARWIAASVETTRTRGLSDAQRETLMANMRLAEQLGAETVTLIGDDIADEIVSYARSQDVTRIVIGKSRQPRWRSLLRPNIVDSLLRESGDIDIYVIQGLGEGGQAPPAPARLPRRWRPYPAAIGLVVVAWVVAFLLQRAGLSEANKAVVFIPAIIGAALWWGLWPGVVAAVASVLAFDFFFVPPYYTFAVQDVQYLITLLVMLGVALLVGTLAARLRRQVQTSRQREERLEILNRLSRTLAGVSGTHQLAASAQRQVATIFGRPARIYLPEGPLLQPVVSTSGEEAASPHQMAVATWAFEHGRVAGNATDTLPDAPALYLPLIAAERTVGVLAVELPAANYPLPPETRRLLETVAGQIALAIAREGSGGDS